MGSESSSGVFAIGYTDTNERMKRYEDWSQETKHETEKECKLRMSKKRIRINKENELAAAHDVDLFSRFSARVLQ